MAFFVPFLVALGVSLVASALSAYIASRRTQASEVGRLDDLRAQTSNEGAPIPRLYGATRVAGNVIWASDFKERVQEIKGGRKFGVAGPKVTVAKVYDYSVDIAIGLCEGEIFDITRIWSDNKLIFDGRPQVTPEVDFRDFSDAVGVERALVVNGPLHQEIIATTIAAEAELCC